MKKMEKEMENVFETKVKEKKQKLKDSEHELTQKHKNVSFSHVRPCRPGRRNERPIGPQSIPDHMFQQKLKYEQDLAELEQKRREFEAEKQEFEARIEAEKVTSGRANASSSAHAAPTSAPPPVKVKKDKLGKLFQKSRVSLDSHSQSSDEGIKGQKTPKHSRFPKF